MKENLHDVSLTTVLYNSAEGLRECLESVRPYVLGDFAEYIIVDNASPDNSLKIAKTVLPEAAFLEAGKNLGFAGGCNFAYPHIKGRYWMLLNPDTVVPENGLRRLVAWMDAHPEIGIGSPNIEGDKGEFGCPGRSFPSLSKSLLELFRLHLLFPKSWREKIFMGSYSDNGNLLYVDWVVGAAVIVRPEAIKDVGLLSEEVLIYGEDSEWCWRFQKAGWRVGICGEVTIIHNEGQSGLKTWGSVDRLRRIWAGIYDSCQMRRGKLYSLALKLVNTLSFAIESYNPRRDQNFRNHIRQILKAHLALLKDNH